MSRSKKTSKFWFYSYASWRPQLWNYVWPYSGGDEWGRLTKVFHVPPFGFVVYVYRTCWCDECRMIRRQTYVMEERAFRESIDRND